MLIGEYQHTMDAKGRLFLPAKLREELGERCILTLGLVDRCLFVFSQEEFAALKSKLDALSIANKDARQFSRFFFAGASECDADKQGRILIPAKLRTYAELDGAATIVGVSNRVEIWNSEKWDEIHSFDSFSPEALAEKMELLGL